MENEWKNLRFHLTEEMNNMMIELLENHKAELLEDFRKEFQKNNVEQINRYNELMNK